MGDVRAHEAVLVDLACWLARAVQYAPTRPSARSACRAPHLHERGVLLFRFAAGVTLEELTAFVEVLTLQVSTVFDRGGLARLVLDRGIARVVVEEIAHDITAEERELQRRADARRGVPRRARVGARRFLGSPPCAAMRATSRSSCMRSPSHLRTTAVACRSCGGSRSSSTSSRSTTTRRRRSRYRPVRRSSGSRAVAEVVKMSSKDLAAETLARIASPELVARLLAKLDETGAAPTTRSWRSRRAISRTRAHTSGSRRASSSAATSSPHGASRRVRRRRAQAGGHAEVRRRGPRIVAPRRCRRRRRLIVDSKAPKANDWPDILEALHHLANTMMRAHYTEWHPAIARADAMAAAGFSRHRQRARHRRASPPRPPRALARHRRCDAPPRDRVLRLPARDDGGRGVVDAVESRLFTLESRCYAAPDLDEAARHAANVAATSAALALAADASREVAIDVTAAAMLHDAGHLLLAAEVRCIPGRPPLWVAAALEHHRGVDGAATRSSSRARRRTRSYA